MKTVQDINWKLLPGMKIKSPKTGYSFEILQVRDDDCFVKCIETGNKEQPFLIWLSDFEIIED